MRVRHTGMSGEPENLVLAYLRRLDLVAASPA